MGLADSQSSNKVTSPSESNALLGAAPLEAGNVTPFHFLWWRLREDSQRSVHGDPGLVHRAGHLLCALFILPSESLASRPLSASSMMILYPRRAAPKAVDSASCFDLKKYQAYKQQGPSRPPRGNGTYRNLWQICLLFLGLAQICLVGRQPPVKCAHFKANGSRSS